MNSPSERAIAATLQQVEALYTGNLRTNGVASTAVGWNTPESQAMRFAQLTRLLEGRTGAVSVNDYGCGYGAQLSYLTDVAGYEVSAYHGYDLSADMLDAARAHLAAYPGALHLHRSATMATEADVSFVSGTFNVRFEADDAAWQAFIARTLDAMFEHSREGFAFNLLSTYVDWRSPALYYGDPLAWFDHCKKRYSRYVTLLHDYPLWEWTILVRKAG